MPVLPFKGLIASALLGLSTWALSQPTATPIGEITDWREANDTVGRFERGHIDILRWEAEHTAAPERASPPTLPPWTLTEAIVSAQRLHPGWLARPGQNALERAQLQTRQRSLALQVERAWWQAVAAQQQLALHRQIVQSAEAGHELALRMVRVGNWPAARQQREALTLLDAQAQWRVAEHQAQAAILELWRVTGTDLSPDTLAQRLPSTWPESAIAPDLADLQTLEAQALQRHPAWPLLSQQAHRAVQAAGSLDPLRHALREATEPDPATGLPQALPTLRTPPRWPHSSDKALDMQLEAEALERRIRQDVRIAFSAWQTAQALLERQALDTQRLLAALEEDMLQRYNGMFKSTWDLLAATRSRLQATQALQQARLHATLAQADLRAVLDGLPYTGIGPRASASAPGTDKGH
jgi:outer membrane protein, multidrug efflux system